MSSIGKPSFIFENTVSSVTFAGGQEKDQNYQPSCRSQTQICRSQMLQRCYPKVAAVSYPHSQCISEIRTCVTRREANLSMTWQYTKKALLLSMVTYTDLSSWAFNPAKHLYFNISGFLKNFRDTVEPETVWTGKMGRTAHKQVALYFSGTYRK